MKAVSLILAALLLVGCEGGYRYPCQDPANKDNEECNRPACEAEGYCYDTLNGLPPQQSEVQVEETPAAEAPAADCNCEQKGE
jgi:hypothetical protein